MPMTCSKLPAATGAPSFADQLMLDIRDGVGLRTCETCSRRVGRSRQSSMIHKSGCKSAHASQSKEVWSHRHRHVRSLLCTCEERALERYLGTAPLHSNSEAYQSCASVSLLLQPVRHGANHNKPLASCALSHWLIASHMFYPLTRCGPAAPGSSVPLPPLATKQVPV